MVLINFWLILSSFWIFQKIQDDDNEINTSSRRHMMRITYLINWYSPNQLVYPGLIAVALTVSEKKAAALSAPPPPPPPSPPHVEPA